MACVQDSRVTDTKTWSKRSIAWSPRVCAWTTCGSSSAYPLRNSDANDLLYAWDASRDYDPAPGLESIRAAVTAINFEDDERNPVGLGVMEREIGRVASGRYVLIPASDRTRGHASASDATLWKGYLVELLARPVR